LVTEWQAYDRQAAIAEQPWYDAPFAARGAWMPFALKKPKTPSVAFARTTYNAPRAGTYELRTGGSLPLIVWINGEKIWEDPPRRAGVHPNVNRTPVRLREGDNEIVVLNNYIAFVGIRPLDL